LPTPVSSVPDSDVFEEPEGQVAGVPVSRPELQRYLAWSAMLMAMLDGIQNNISPGDRSGCRRIRTSSLCITTTEALVRF
jgi:glutamine synthetase